jgi:steroid 5-alpha reductase family enzyme
MTVIPFLTTFPSSFLTMQVGGLVLMMGMMAWVGLVSNRLKNAGLVDIFWAGGFTLLLAHYYLFAVVFENVAVLTPRHSVLACMVVFASLRLASYLIQRFRHEFPREDGRYHALRVLLEQTDSPLMVDFKFFLLFQFQAVLMVLVLSSVAVASLNGAPDLGLLEWIACFIWLVGFFGQAVADNQLKQFKNRPENKGQVCQVGLWRYSRHPNHFFEWVMWFSYWVFACASPYGAWTVFSPAIMFFFLTQVSGVKATEEQSLRTRGELYRQYQQSTSAFFPWWPKQ